MPNPTTPSVAAVMLTRSRDPRMLHDSIRCFSRQTYKNAFLVVFDTGLLPARGIPPSSVHLFYPGILDLCSIGQLRNLANSNAFADIICHWDDDDISCPTRIEEQVDLLIASRADAVGYHEMPFLDIRPSLAEAWNYIGSPGYAIGASLCYWKARWASRPFLDVDIGEDSKFLDGTDVDGRQASPPLVVRSASALNRDQWNGMPAMISLVHIESTSARRGFRNFNRGGPFVPSNEADLVRQAVALYAK